MLAMSHSRQVSPHHLRNKPFSLCFRKNLLCYTYSRLRASLLFVLIQAFPQLFITLSQQGRDSYCQGKNTDEELSYHDSLI